MTKHAAEALFACLAFIAATSLATKQQIVMLFACAAVVLAVVGIILVASGN